MGRKRKRRNRKQDELRLFLRRHRGKLTVAGTVLGLVVAVVTLFPTFQAAFLAEDADARASTARLSVAGLDVTTTAKVDTENVNMLTGEVDQGGRQDAAMAKVILRNSGEQSAIIRELRVHVSRVWALHDCHGGGPGLTKVHYDFVIPGDIDGRPMPLTMRKPIDFTVAGQSDDRLGVTIGEESIGETGWNWVTMASVELVLDDGSTVRSEEFILMSPSRTAAVIGMADTDSEFREMGYECVLANARMLQDARSVAADLRQQLGVVVEIARSDAYASLTPGYWVAYYPGDFDDGRAALRYRAEHGLTTEDACVGRFFSVNADDRSLACRFSDPAGSPRCHRP